MYSLRNGVLLPSILSRVDAKSVVSLAFQHVAEDLLGKSQGDKVSSEITNDVNKTADPVIQNVENSASATGIGAVIVSGLKMAGGQTEAQTQSSPVGEPPASLTVATLVEAATSLIDEGFTYVLGKLGVPAQDDGVIEGYFMEFLATKTGSVTIPTTSPAKPA